MSVIRENFRLKTAEKLRSLTLHEEVQVYACPNEFFSRIRPPRLVKQWTAYFLYSFLELGEYCRVIKCIISQAA